MPCTPVSACVLENVKLSPTAPVALTLFNTSVGFSSTVLTVPVACTPVSVTVLLCSNVPIEPVAVTLASNSATFICTTFTVPVALTLFKISVGLSSTVFTAPVP